MKPLTVLSCRTADRYGNEIVTWFDFGAISSCLIDLLKKVMSSRNGAEFFFIKMAIFNLPT